ncbi:hypothetical protein HanRHA438_Chr05g0232481 [Helianthus annuus]|uniref:Uncharacterized protein n=1 Tax=Helianthus annuus TaxID=4232 RepID=A0A9K3J1J3_HELAN|nr:hypothetical protein HanXRQr2_Chr05g0223391 [Helianthus annuus]KAJ0585203.1 hypothetical protein HanHA89_Chr05g0197581 [Helianthus annuus]KAJ0919688.1 hypothetical protein HanRHA438_Chr05g0232481 [Helianthus annuus]KAJ0923424.1 hypothetical protein HanPSC8_Chr05g0215721 [Helianthus annuus]
MFCQSCQIFRCTHVEAAVQDFKKRNKSIVDTTSQRPDEGSSGKQKVDSVFIDQEACSSSNQQSLLSSIDESVQNGDHNDLNCSIKDQDAADRAENGTVPPPTVVVDCSSEKLKLKQVSDNQEPCCSSNQQLVVSSSDEPDQNIHNDPRSSTEFSGNEDPQSSPEAITHKGINQQQEQIQEHEQERVTVVGVEHSSGKQKIEQLSADNESGNRFTQLLLVDPMNELDQNNDCTEHRNSSEENQQEYIRIDQQQEHEQNQRRSQDAGKQQENVTVDELEHSSAKQKTEELSDKNETGNRFAHLLLVNPRYELERNNDHNEDRSSSELSYHDEPESSPEATVHDRVK